MSSPTDGGQKPLSSNSLFGNTTFGGSSLTGTTPSSNLFGTLNPGGGLSTLGETAATYKPENTLATTNAAPAGSGTGSILSGGSQPSPIAGNPGTTDAGAGSVNPVTSESGADKAHTARTELELFEHEKIEDVLNGWERKLTRHVDEFRRYSRAVIEMDSVLFDYVDKLMEIQKQQEEVQYRQQELSAVVEKIELKQKSILDTLNQMNRRWSDKIAQITHRANPLESQAVAVNKLVSDLETEVLDITKQLDQVQAKAYPDGLYQLLLLTNSHCKYVTRLNDMADQINRQISTL